MGDWRVTAKVRLGVRFEDFGTGKAQVAGPKIPVTAANGTKSERSPLRATSDDSAPTGTRRFLVTSPTGPTVSSPQDRRASQDGLTHIVAGVMPIEAQVQRNGVRVADTANIAIPFIDLPLYPLIVRSAWIEVYLGVLNDVQGEAAAFGTERSESGVSVPAALCPDTWIDALGRTRTNLRFRGWVDKWTVQHKADTVPMVELECRDNTALLIEQVAPPKLVIDMKKPLDEAVATYLANFPQFAGLAVEYRGEGEPPTLANVLSKTAFRPELGPSPSKGGGTDKLSVWDYITDVAGCVGLSAMVDDVTVVLQQPRSLLGDAFRDPRDPFGGVRRLVHGANLESVSHARNYAKRTAQNVEVRCYLPGRKKTLVVRYPEKANADAKPGDGATENKYTIHRVSGISDEATLKAIAQSIHEQVGRNELEVPFEMRDLGSYDSRSGEPDMLDAKPGAPITFEVERSDDEEFTAGKIENEATATATLTERMRATGFDDAFAQAYARAYVASRALGTYRLRQLVLKWSVEEGISIGGTAVNYITVRHDPKDEPRKPSRGPDAPPLPPGAQRPPPGLDAPPAYVEGSQVVGYDTLGRPIYSDGTKGSR